MYEGDAEGLPRLLVVIGQQNNLWTCSEIMTRGVKAYTTNLAPNQSSGTPAQEPMGTLEHVVMYAAILGVRKQYYADEEHENEVGDREGSNRSLVLQSDHSLQIPRRFADLSMLDELLRSLDSEANQPDQTADSTSRVHYKRTCGQEQAIPHMDLRYLQPPMW